MNNTDINKLVVNEPLLRKIVYSIDKAITDDIPQFLRDNPMETCNYIIQLRGDKINDNLRNHVVNADIDLIPFKRYVWSGRILRDSINHITYTITTNPTLEAIPKKKNRKNPHFLQSILFTENKECKALIRQMELSDFGIVPFDAEELVDDYNTIMQGIISKGEDYKHYVITYKTQNNELKEVILKLLDKDFNIVDEKSLNEYIKPDFSRLTGMEPADQNEEKVEDNKSKKLVALKSGIKPKLREVEKQAWQKK